MKGRTLREVVTAHVEPVLVEAGFTAGQWGGSFTSATFCAGEDEYRRRHPTLVVDDADGSHCIDVVVEGEPLGGITRLDVEFEPLDALLRRAGHDEDADALPDRLRLADADEDARAIAAMFARLYGVGDRVT